MKIIAAFVLALLLLFGGGSYYKNQQAKQKAQEAEERMAKKKADEAADRKVVEEAAARKAAEEAAEIKAAEEADAKKDAEVKSRKAGVEKEMRAYFESILVDPGSVQFRNMQVYLNVPASKLRTSGTGEVEVVCGEYNSKNRMGGYIGFKYFYWDSGERKAFQASDSTLGPMMEELAQKTCAGLNESKLSGVN